MIGARIVGTGSSLGRTCVQTERLLEVVQTRRPPSELRRLMGIDTRYWAAEGQTLVDLAAEALTGALVAAGRRPEELQRIILATTTGGASLIPGTAPLLRERLGIDDTCDAFDIKSACCGFLTGLDLAARSVATGMGPVAVVAAELFSVDLHPSAPRSYLVMGDAAGAAIVEAARGAGGVLASHLRSRNDLPGQMISGARVLGEAAAPLVIDARLEDLAASAMDAIRGACQRVLDEARVGWSDVDWFLCHQPNGALFDAIVAACGVDPARTEPVAREIGSVGAASVPFALDRLVRAGRVRPGQLVLLSAVGVGTAYGAILLRVDG